MCYYYVEVSVHSHSSKYNMSDEIKYPMRVNRHLYVTGVCSRREADRLIEQKKVFINGKTAVLGQKIEKTDTVSLSKEAANRTYKYFLFNKPRGIVSHNPQPGEESIEDISD